MKIFKILTIITLLFLSVKAEAQITKQAQVGFRFLTNPVSAEVMGRGGVGIISTQNSNAIFWNPAQLGLITNTVDVNLNYTKGIAEINYNAAAAALRLGDFGVIAFDVLAMDYGTFYQTLRADNDKGYEETGTFSPTGMMGGVAFSQLVSERFSYGVHLKYAYQDLGEAWVSTGGDSLGNADLSKKKYDNGVLAMDVGAFYDFQYNGIKFAAVLHNISREVSYEAEEFPLPFDVSFGATIEPVNFFTEMNNDQRFILSFESLHPRDFGEKFKIGGEYIFSDLMFLRAGYMSNFDQRNWTFGAGLKHQLSNFPIRIDYAFQPYRVFGNVHHLSIGFGY